MLPPVYTGGSMVSVSVVGATGVRLSGSPTRGQASGPVGVQRPDGRAVGCDRPRLRSNACPTTARNLGPDAPRTVLRVASFTLAASLIGGQPVPECPQRITRAAKLPFMIRACAAERQ